MSNRIIYVGNLPEDIHEQEIEELFYKYGKIVEIDIKRPRRPPAYCFVEFEDYRDAKDAIDGRANYRFDGARLRVEPMRDGRRNSSDRWRGGGGGGGGRGRDLDLRRRTDFRVLVTGLPSSASWQDLKDHMKSAGHVEFAQVFGASDGKKGVVDYSKADDMDKAIKELDRTEFTNRYTGSTHYHIRVKEDRGRSRSRSRSRGRGSRSRSRSFSRSRSPSRSPAGRRRRRSPARRRTPPARRRTPSPAGRRSPRSTSHSPVSPKVDGKVESPSQSPIKTETEPKL